MAPPSQPKTLCPKGDHSAHHSTLLARLPLPNSSGRLSSPPPALPGTSVIGRTVWPCCTFRTIPTWFIVFCTGRTFRTGKPFLGQGKKAALGARAQARTRPACLPAWHFLISPEETIQVNPFLKGGQISKARCIIQP